MISSHWNSDTASSRFVTSQPSPLDEIDKTMPGLSVPFDPEFVAEHKPLEPNPHHRVPQILFLFGRRNEMWVRVSTVVAGTVMADTAGRSLTGCDILRLRHNPKILGGYDAEIVGDSIAELVPFCRNGSRQEG